MDNLSYIKGRMGYEWSTCSRGSEALFRKIVQKYGEPNKIAATRYGFELFVYFEKDTESSKTFRLDNVGSSFLRDDDSSLLSQVIEDDSDYAPIKEYCSKNGFHYLSLASVVDLFDVFVLSGIYQSVVVSLIISYGADVKMLHQAGLICLGSPHNKILLYEPYGMYKKFGAEYITPVRSIIAEILKIHKFSEFTFDTYHSYFSIPKGIQNLMLEYNERNREKFLPKYKEIKCRLLGSSEEKVSSHVNAVDEIWDHENDEVDKAFEVVTLMKKADGTQEVNNAARLYYQYSAKTCVSIFLVEMTNFMIFIKSGNTLSHIQISLSSWYREFVNEPTPAILDKLYDLIVEMYGDKSEQIFEQFSELSSKKICENLTN